VTNNFLPWYAARVKSNFEHAVSRHLRARGYEEFLPTYRARRRWSDRIKEIQVPLFGGYVFCRLEAGNRLPVLTTPGVVHLVGIGKTPCAVAEDELEAVRRIVESELLARPWPFLQLGQHVELVRGPLAGVEGILTKFKGNYRLVVSVQLLQRSVAVEIEGDWVRPRGRQYFPVANAVADGAYSPKTAA